MDFFAGCVGGAAGCIVTHPLDTIKVRLQCQSTGTYKGILDCAHQTIKHETARGLYKGMSSPLSTVALLNAVCFGSFGYILRRCEDPTAISSHFLAGTGAGLAMCPIANPVELVKCKLQMQGIATRQQTTVPYSAWSNLVFKRRRLHGYVFTGPLDYVRTIYLREGVVGLNRGMIGTLIRRPLGIGIYFTTYEWLQRTYKNMSGRSSCPLWYLFLAGGVTGCVPSALIYPVDVIKARIQCDGVYNPLRQRFTYKYRGYVDCALKAVRAEGLWVLYRGLAPTCLKSFPNNGVVLTVVYLIRSFYKDEDSDNSQITALEIANEL